MKQVIMSPVAKTVQWKEDGTSEVAQYNEPLEEGATKSKSYLIQSQNSVEPAISIMVKQTSCKQDMGAYEDKNGNPIQ